LKYRSMFTSSAMLNRERIADPLAMPLARTMPFSSVNFEAGVDDKGERYIWLPRAVVDRLRSLRAPGESYSDVILRLAKGGSVEPR